MKEKRYGVWAGNPKGNKQDPDRCVEEVIDGWYMKQCTRKKKIGDYCTQHSKKHQKGELTGDKE